MAESKQRIYALGGLGADHRVFQHLYLNAEIHVLNWDKPHLKESLSDYSLRMSHQIETGFEGWLIGVSFGGIVAQEIAKIRSVKVMLISSVAYVNEIPRVYQWIGKMRLISIVPAFCFRLPKFLAVFLFGAENHSLLLEIIRDTDPNFVKWALQQIVSWQNNERLFSCRIHGNNDRLFPMVKRMNIEHKINGGHFMIVDQSKEISTVINEKLIK
jgi:pimeloyl-ACP methyl ester carboxylesterase